MKYHKLGQTGWQISTLSLGASSFGGAHGPVVEKECVRTVRTALDGGINFLDTAPYDGAERAEEVLGKCLKGVPRSRYYLAGRVGRPKGSSKEHDFSAEAIMQGVDRSLRNLRVAHFDLLLCQDIEFTTVRELKEDVLPAFRKLRQQGKVHKIGLTGFSLKAFRQVLQELTVDVVMPYGHYCLHNTTLVQMFPFLQSKAVGVLNAAPFGMGLLTEKGPPKWHPAPAVVRDACLKALAHARKKKGNVAKLALQFAVTNSGFASTVFSTGHLKKLKEAVRWLEQPFDLELFAEMQEILRPIQNQSWHSGRKEYQ
ncbi:MAG TPA: aldo/keto reductase [Verrucomicrobiae bacterium]|jgi:aryl-alcohol dehydrogenase-like predicted oxidoreductase